MRAPNPTIREGVAYLILAVLALAVIAHGERPMPGSVQLAGSLK